jgi:hypothetical protein
VNRQTRLTDQPSIKVLAEDEILPVPADLIRNDDERGLPANCFIVPMQVLDEPEPIPRARPRNR